MELILFKSERSEIKRKYLEVFSVLLGLSFILFTSMQMMGVEHIYKFTAFLSVCFILAILIIKRERELKIVKHKIDTIEILLDKIEVETDMVKGKVYHHMITGETYICDAVGAFIVMLTGSGSTGIRYSLTKSGERNINELIETGILPNTSRAYMKESHLEEVKR